MINLVFTSRPKPKISYSLYETGTREKFCGRYFVFKKKLYAILKTYEVYTRLATVNKVEV